MFGKKSRIVREYKASRQADAIKAMVKDQTKLEPDYVVESQLWEQGKLLDLANISPLNLRGKGRLTVVYLRRTA